MNVPSNAATADCINNRGLHINSENLLRLPKLYLPLINVSIFMRSFFSIRRVFVPKIKK